jgi:hypothetical protein
MSLRSNDDENSAPKTMLLYEKLKKSVEELRGRL